MVDGAVSATDWIWGITYSVLASIIGGASKLAIRKSWLIHAKVHSGCSSVALPEALDASDRESKELTTIEIIESAFRTEHDGCGCSISKARAVSWFLYFFGMIGMSFLNPLCCVLAMQYANPSILAPFSGLTLVWVILFSGVVIGEHPQLSQKVACSLIVLGEVLVALFGDHTNAGNMDVDDVIASYVDPSFVVFMFAMFSIITTLLLIIRHFPTTSLLRKVAWGCLGGAITGFQNYLKDSLTIFKETREDGGILPPMFFILFILAMTTGFAGLLCLSACMKRYDATYASAMFVVSFVITASSMSAVHYHTFAGIDGERAIVVYLFGLSVLIYGATILVKPQAAASCLPDKGDFSVSDSSEDSLGSLDGSKEEKLLEVA